ncbi:MAG: TraB/GumN family protein [Proteobacteria bacterium]|nr:TraB/GumN family protein [Pseudomonadota bacterium]
MSAAEDSGHVYILHYKDKEIFLTGTAHVSRESVDLVEKVIREEKPDTVCVELCESRYHAVTQKDRWQEMDIVKVIREKKSFLLLSNLLLASFQKKIADKFGVRPGEEMIKAIDTAKETGAHVHLADREINVTLSRTWRSMGFLSKMKLMFQLLLSLGNTDEIEEEDIERMKKEDVLQTVLADVEKSHPIIRKILIDERDQYLCEKIRTAPGQRIVAVVGAGHVPGIQKYLNQDIDIQALEQLPPKGKMGSVLKWLIPLAIFALIAGGFFFKGSHAGTQMVGWWVAANGILAGLGAVIAFAHPLTILSAVIAAPITSLNPMVAAGWVSGLTEAYVRRPKVRDLEQLPEDILSIRGFWRNKVTRILLVVVFTNLGSTFGTFVALPLMYKVIG